METEEKKIRNFVYKELSKLNFRRYTKGFKYLSEAIYICIEDENCIENLSKNVFPKILEKYNEKSIYNVKWCIDQVIKTMYNNTDIKVLGEYFNLDKDLKPSLKFIVYCIVCKYYSCKKSYLKENDELEE